MNNNHVVDQANNLKELLQENLNDHNELKRALKEGLLDSMNSFLRRWNQCAEMTRLVNYNAQYGPDN